MKLKKIFMTLLLSLGVVAGAAVGVSATVLNETKEFQVAEAATLTGGELLFLKPNSNWNQSNARFAAYFCNGTSSATWQSMKKVVDSQLYWYVNVPTGNFKNVIFVRMNPSTSDNNWNNGVKWNQTADLIYDGTNNLYEVKEGTWDKGGGTWSTFNVYLKGDFYENNWADNNEYKFDFTKNTSDSIDAILKANHQLKIDMGGVWLGAEHFGDYFSGSTGDNAIVNDDGLYEFTFNVASGLKVIKKELNITYNANGGTGGVALTYKAPYNADFSLKPHSFENNNKIFLGWSTTQNGDAKYKNCEKINISKEDIQNDSLTLYAQWGELNTNTFRIFLNRQENNEVGYFWNLHLWNDGDVDVEIAPAGYMKVNNTNTFVYYNVDKSLSDDDCYIQFKCYKTDDSSIVNNCSTNEKSTDKQAVKKYNPGDNSNIFYINKTDSEYYLTKGTFKAGETITEANVYIRVLETYYTCSSDKDNGYGKAGELFITWFKNQDKWFMDETKISQIILSDFRDLEEGDDSSEVYSNEEKVSETNALEKITRMMNNQTKAANSNRLFGLIQNNSNDSLIIILIVSISLLCAFGILLKFRKKEDK